MTKDGSFKKVVRRHAEATGQRYTEALTDLEGLQDRMFHQPVAERLLAHLRERYGVDALVATQLSVHNNDVWRIDRGHGDSWVARVYPPARPKAGADGDAAILRFLERHDYPAERLAADDGEGLPEALLHGNLLHATDHAVMTEAGPVAINWNASGRGPRMADFAYLMWGTWLDEPSITAAVNAYRRHIEVTDEEFDRLEAVMGIRALYLMGFECRRYVENGQDPKVEWFDHEYLSAAAAATRAPFRR